MSVGPILAVDDEPLNLDALRHVLSRDYRLVYARNGREALAAAVAHLPSSSCSTSKCRTWTATASAWP